MAKENFTKRTDLNLFLEIIETIKQTEFDSPAFSFFDYKNSCTLLAHSNKEWGEKYLEEKLYLIDPICDIENEFYKSQLNGFTPDQLILNFDDIHTKENGNMLRKFRSTFSVNSGGVTMSIIDDILISIAWWSSHNQENSNVRACFLDPNKRGFYLETSQKVVEIFKSKRNIIFGS